MNEILPGNRHLDALRAQLLSLADAFATEARPLGDMLAAMVNDVARASGEPLEIFPVCHHSPASAIHLLKRLRERPVRVIFIELCEDFQGSLEALRGCRLPVALQAFASSSEVFPPAWAPLNVVAPITEFSAEYQAIAFAMETPGIELVFVDRSVDHIFQWMPKEDDALHARVGPDEGDEDEGDAAAAGSGEEAPAKASHGSAVGVQIGRMEPTLDSFLTVLLKNARVRHFAEWWDQYVEQAVAGSDYETYRHVMFLVGSLLRRLGRREEYQREDRLRERFMWTRMKQHLAAKGIAPGEAIYICGASHTASDVEEFGTATDKVWEIPPRTSTPWLYGLVPSSFAAIERQFGNPAGTVSLCESSWSKSLAAMNLVPFRIAKEAKGAAKAAAKGKKKGKAAPVVEALGEGGVSASAASPAEGEGLHAFLTRPPELARGDEEELLHWCVEIVRLARENGYLTSTADAIAIYQTAVLLANMRARNHPSPYDFQDAAITCLEKDRTPKKRNVQRLCEILLGGDRIGMVAYASLPALAQDVYDRLRPLGLKLSTTAQERALIDFRKHPELLPCSDLLWRLRYVAPALVKPIMGERALGGAPVQESWEVMIGKHQSGLIQLAYEGVSVESVIELRLRRKAFAPKSGPVAALEAVEESILYLKSPRLTGELGERAIELLRDETGAKDAPQVFERVRRLVHYYRSTPHGLPDWLRRFVTTGYSHYATLLPAAFQDRGTRPEEVAAMLAFLFTLESLALSFGCQRSQLVIAVGQAGPVTDDPMKIGLLWSAEWLLGTREVGQIRAFLDEVLENVLRLPTFPSYVSGFLLALAFTPLVGKLVVELLSKAFERLPDDVLMPWMPSLIMALRPHGADLVGTLLKEAAACFPGKAADLAGWRPPWGAAAESAPQAVGPGEAAVVRAEVAALSPEEAAVRALLGAHPAATNAMAALFGEPAVWTDAAAVAEATGTQASPGAASHAEAALAPSPSVKLLAEYPATAAAMAALLGASG